MQKVWLESYPVDVPAEIDIAEHSSLNDLLAASCRKHPSRPAFANLGTTISYAQLDRLSRDFGAWLEHLTTLKRGSRVAIMMPNLLQYPITLFGILRAGMIVVNVNPLYTERELSHQLKDSGAEAIVILENFAHVLEKALPNTPVKHVITTKVGDILPPFRRPVVNLAVKYVKKMVPEWRIDGAVSFRTALRLGAARELREAQLHHQDIAFLQYTGGTTGTSKGAILSHGNMVANVLQCYAWSRGVFKEGEEIGITALPLYHIFSLTVNCLLIMKWGGLNVLITNPKDIPAFIVELKKWPFSVMTGVNTLFNALMNAPGFGAVNFSRLKFAVGGGAAIHELVAKRWEASTGRPLMEGYGLTEASPLVASNPVGSPHCGAIGYPVPSTDVTIRDEEGRELPLGAQGEIWARGPQITQGYWNRPEETKEAITPDGWLRTGDIGVMDSKGLIRITDRKKDMILVSGFNVYPNEVEEVIASMPGVLECAVIGIPDTITGEQVKAFVVPKDPDLTAEAVIAFSRQRMTKYKVPKFVEFRTELPKNPIGKVLRRELRTPAAQAAANDRTTASPANAV
jgi:long-chain acyl-CoA synthetase